jgi:hypothetical protein
MNMLGDARKGSFGKTYLVEEKKNPSANYYALPELERCGGEVLRIDFTQCPAPE